MAIFLGKCGAECPSPCDVGGQVETYTALCGTNKKRHIIHGDMLPVGFWNGTAYTCSAIKYKLTGDVTWRNFSAASFNIFRDFGSCSIEPILANSTLGRVSIATDLALLDVELISNVGAGTIHLSDLSYQTFDMLKEDSVLDTEANSTWFTITGTACGGAESRNLVGPPCAWSDTVGYGTLTGTRTHTVIPGGGTGFGIRYATDREITLSGSATITNGVGTLAVAIEYTKAACVSAVTGGTLLITVDWDVNNAEHNTLCANGTDHGAITVDESILIPICSGKQIYLRITPSYQDQAIIVGGGSLAAYCAAGYTNCGGGNYSVGRKRGITGYTLAVVCF
jgi:hypothetical protein